MRPDDEDNAPAADENQGHREGPREEQTIAEGDVGSLADVLRPADIAIASDADLTPPSDFPDLNAVDGVGDDDDSEPFVPDLGPDDAAPQPEDTPAEGYGPDSGPEVDDDCCPHGYFVGRGCPNGCVDDEGQRAEPGEPTDDDPEPPAVEAEAVFDADASIVEFVEVPEGPAPDGDDGLEEDEHGPFDEDDEGEFADLENEPDEVGSAFDTLLAAVFNKGWNGALDALGAKFSDTGAFLEVRAAIEKLRK